MRKLYNAFKLRQKPLKEPNCSPVGLAIRCLKYFELLTPENKAAVVGHSKPIELAWALSALKIADSLMPRHAQAIIYTIADNDVESLVKAYGSRIYLTLRTADQADILVTPKNVEAIQRSHGPCELARGLAWLKFCGLLSPENQDVLIIDSRPYQLARALKILTDGDFLTPENRASVVGHSHPDMLASALIILEEAGLLTPKGRDDLAAHVGLDSLQLALTVLKAADLLTLENINAVAVHANPDEIARTLSILKDDNLLQSENMQAVMDHADPINLAWILKALKAADLLTPENQTIAAKCSDLKNLRIALENLNAVNLLVKENCQAILTHVDPVGFVSTLKNRKMVELLTSLTQATDVEGAKSKAAKLETLKVHDANFDKRLKMLIHLETVGCLIPENQNIVGLRVNIDELVRALSNLEEGDLSVSENVQMVIHHADPLNLAKTLNVLKIADIFSTENRDLVAKHHKLESLRIALEKFNAADLLRGLNFMTQANFRVIASHRDPEKLVDGLEILKQAEFLTSENVKAVAAARVSPERLAWLLRALGERGHLTPENVQAVAAYDGDPMELRLALIDVDNAGLLTPENLQVLFHHAGPRSFARAITALGATNFLTSEDRSAIAAHGNLKDLPDAFATLRSASILLQENVRAVIRHADPLNLASALKNILGAVDFLAQEERDAIVAHDNPKDLAQAFIILKKADFLITAEDRAAIVAHGNPKDLAQAFLTLKNANFLITSENRVAVAAHDDPKRLAQAFATLKNTDFLITLEDYAAISSHGNLKGLLYALVNLNTAKLLTEANFIAATAYTRAWNGYDDFPRPLTQQNLDAYVNVMTKKDPRIWATDAHFLIKLSEAAIRRGSATDDFPSFEKIKLPFAIDQKVFSTIKNALEEKASSEETATSQLLFIQGLLLEGRMGSATQQYFINLSPEVETVLRAELKKNKATDLNEVADLLDKQRLIFCGEVKSSHPGKKIIKSIAALQPSGDRLCQAAQKYVAAASKDSDLKELVQFILWEMRVHYSDVFDSIDKLFRIPLFKEWSESPPDCYGGETAKKLPQIAKEGEDAAIEKLLRWFTEHGSKQEIGSKLANELKEKREKFLTEQGYSKKDGVNQYISNIKETAFTSDLAKVVVAHRTWNGVIVNSLIGLTIIGLFALAAKAVHSKLTRGNVSLFFPSKSQQCVDKAFKELAQEARFMQNNLTK